MPFLYLSNTEDARKINLVVAASKHAGPLRSERPQYVYKMASTTFLVDYIKNEVVGFDENFASSLAISYETK